MAPLEILEFVSSGVRGLFASFKMSCVCHDCSRITPPPWLSPPGIEDVHGESEGRAIVYWACRLLSGGERALKRSNDMAGTACSVPAALY